MSSDLQSVIISKSSDGIWQATHVPSGKKTSGSTPEDAQLKMRDSLGLSEKGESIEPPTSGQFQGLAQAIAVFLEGPVSEALAFHSGFARLKSFDSGVVSVHLGGGCQGCPSSQITLFNGVKTQLQSRFGEEVIEDVVLA